MVSCCAAWVLRYRSLRSIARQVGGWVLAGLSVVAVPRPRAGPRCISFNHAGQGLLGRLELMVAGRYRVAIIAVYGHG